MKEINLSKNLKALVDDEDYEYINQFKWYAKKSAKKYYACRDLYVDKKRRHIYMHRLILDIVNDNNILCDHINHNTLDNQRNNLRKCDVFGNARNISSKYNGTSKYLGVTFILRGKHPLKKWRSTIGYNRRSKTIGYFEKEEDAAKAYDEYAKKYYKEFANLNFK